MISAAISFFVLALVAYFFGASGIAGMSMEIGKVLLVVFLILSTISFVLARVRGRGGKFFGGRLN